MPGIGHSTWGLLLHSCFFDIRHDESSPYTLGRMYLKKGHGKTARRFLKSTVCRNLWRMEQIRSWVWVTKKSCYCSREFHSSMLQIAASLCGPMICGTYKYFPNPGGDSTSCRHYAILVEKTVESTGECGALYSIRQTSTRSTNKCVVSPRTSRLFDEDVRKVHKP